MLSITDPQAIAYIVGEELSVSTAGAEQGSKLSSEKVS